MGCFQVFDKFIKVEFLFLPEDIIHAVNMRDLFRFELGIAACDDQYRIGVLSPDTMNHLPVLMVRRVGDRAGVDDAYIRRFTVLRTCMTTGDKRLGERTTLGKIEFAT